MGHCASRVSPVLELPKCVVWIVEDNNIAGKMLQKFCGQIEVVHHWFPTVAMLMGKLQRPCVEPPHIVWMDYDLSNEINGVGLTRQIKSVFPACCVLVQTSTSSPKLQFDFFAAGARYMTRKPVSYTTFKDAMQYWIPYSQSYSPKWHSKTLSQTTTAIDKSSKAGVCAIAP
jgi:DNA-binding NarL/FixJ family response regulator